MYTCRSEIYFDHQNFELFVSLLPSRSLVQSIKVEFEEKQQSSENSKKTFESFFWIRIIVTHLRILHLCFFFSNLSETNSHTPKLVGSIQIWCHFVCMQRGFIEFQFTFDLNCVTSILFRCAFLLKFMNFLLFYLEMLPDLLLRKHKQLLLFYRQNKSGKIQKHIENAFLFVWVCECVPL